MKKLSIVFALTQGIVISVQAQKGYFGFRAGAANPDYYGSDFFDAKSAASILLYGPQQRAFISILNSAIISGSKQNLIM